MKFASAALLSIAFHLALAFILAAPFAFVKNSPDIVEARIDLAEMELSFSEAPDELSPAQAVEDAPQVEPLAKPRLSVLRDEEVFSAAAAPVRVLPADGLEPAREFEKFDSEKAVVVEMSAPAAAKAPRQARVDAPARPVRPIKPVYPRSSRRRGEEGGVMLEFMIDESGRVKDAKVVGSSGFADLDRSALEAVCAAVFEPARQGKHGISSIVRLVIQFKLKEGV